MSDFKRALAFVLKHEGGKSDNPKDPGGRTNQGVIQRTYDAWRTKKKLPKRDVFSITQEEVAAIYFEDYWTPVTAGRPWPLNAVMFDSAVNCGVSRATGWIEAAKKTVAASDPQRMDRLTSAVLAARQAHYDSLKPKMGWAYNGWVNRLNDLRNLAGGTPAPKPAVKPAAQPSAEPLYYPVPMGPGAGQYNNSVGLFLDDAYYQDLKSEHPGVDANQNRFGKRDGPDIELGKPYAAAYSGTVVYVGNHRVWGWITLVKHVHPAIGKFWSMYAHSETVEVKVGQTVRGGQRIGTIGKGGGNKMFAHLHFELRKFGPEDGLEPDFWPSAKYPNRKQAQDCIKRNYYDPMATFKKYGAINPTF